MFLGLSPKGEPKGSSVSPVVTPLPLRSSPVVTPLRSGNSRDSLSLVPYVGNPVGNFLKIASGATTVKGAPSPEVTPVVTPLPDLPNLGDFVLTEKQYIKDQQNSERDFIFIIQLKM